MRTLRLHSSKLDDPDLREARGGVVALGNFDGVHAGHLSVMSAARELASELSCAYGVATFDPSPAEFFRPDAPSQRIHSPVQRARRFNEVGHAFCVLIGFDAVISGMSDETFVDEVLVRVLGVRGVCVGRDFRFGAKRAGDVARLKELCGARGIEVRVAAEVLDGAEKASSTRIRELIRKGDMDAVCEALGEFWRYEAVVVDGQKQGRNLGFPTANMTFLKTLEPAHGIYAVWARIEGETEWRMGAANFGRTPTTGERAPLLEVHLLDFKGDLYGKCIETAFVSYLRPEEHFDSLEALVQQMALDCEKARDVLTKRGLPVPAGNG